MQGTGSTIKYSEVKPGQLGKQMKRDYWYPK